MNCKFSKTILFFCFLILIFFCFSLVAVKAQSTASTTEEIVDSDHDGLSDTDESNIYKSDPNKWDTDGDGYGDGAEVWGGFSPLKGGDAKLGAIDSDGDWLVDWVEEKLGTDSANKDTDGDGHNDGVEVVNGYNPLLGAGNRQAVRQMEIDLTNQRMEYFFNNINIGTVLVSTGKSPLITPIGIFHILRKRPTVHYAGSTYNYPNTKWNLEFKQGFYIHGAYWHNLFGKKAVSHGCVNVAYKDMKHLYNFMDIGDEVRVSGKTPSGIISVNN